MEIRHCEILGQVHLERDFNISEHITNTNLKQLYLRRFREVQVVDGVILVVVAVVFLGQVDLLDSEQLQLH